MKTKHFVFLILLIILPQYGQTPAQIKEEIQTLIKEAPFAFPEIQIPEFPSRDFQVSAYGAVGDGRTLNTKAIQKALNECSASGGGRVVIPIGFWQTGPLELKSNTNLHLERGAVLIFSNDHDVYELRQTSSKSYEVPSPIFARGAKNVAITGEGIIDGNGKGWRPVKRSKLTESQWKELVAAGGVVNEKGDMWWPNKGALEAEQVISSKKKEELTMEDAFKLKEFYRPHMLVMEKCSGILLDEITLQNSPKFAMYLRNCVNIIVRKVQVRNEWWAQNGDGLDFSSCQNIIVYGCNVNAGDDGICFKSSGKLVPENLLENVIVADCYVYHGHGGVVFGSNTDGGMKNVFVKRCTFMFTDTGLRFKSNIGRGGTVEKLFIEDITMKDIEKQAITFDVFYNDAAAVRPAGERRDSAKYPCFRDIRMKNIISIGAESPLFIRALPGSVRDITIEESVFQAEQGASLSAAEGVTVRKSHFEVKHEPYFALTACEGIVLDAVSTGDISGGFMKVSGASSRNIAVRNSPDTNGMKRISFENGAQESMVTFK